ncbi:MAG: ComF family protein [Deltaproteobacteria bacterium]|nr:ComF family protein [Deltaproteobacteria bacterium]
MNILNFFFPRSCAVCSTMTRTQFICDRCHPTLPWIKDGGDGLGAKQTFDWHRAPLKYDGPVVSLIHSFKFLDGLPLIPLLSSWMAKSLPDKTNWLIPIPLSPKRLRQRTFNQSLELAKGVSKLTGIPVLRNSLQKIRETPPQTGLKKREREKNLKGCFSWAGKTALCGKRVVLIDDVYTTGSTLSEAAEVLRGQNPAGIGALTLARTI